MRLSMGRSFELMGENMNCQNLKPVVEGIIMSASGMIAKNAKNVKKINKQ